MPVQAPWIRSEGARSGPVADALPCHIRTTTGQAVGSFTGTLRTLHDADVRVRSGNRHLVLVGIQRCSADHAGPTSR